MGCHTLRSRSKMTCGRDRGAARVSEGGSRRSAAQLPGQPRLPPCAASASPAGAASRRRSAAARASRAPPAGPRWPPPGWPRCWRAAGALHHCPRTGSPGPCGWGDCRRRAVGMQSLHVRGMRDGRAHSRAHSTRSVRVWTCALPHTPAQVGRGGQPRLHGQQVTVQAVVAPAGRPTMLAASVAARARDGAGAGPTLGMPRHARQLTSRVRRKRFPGAAAAGRCGPRGAGGSGRRGGGRRQASEAQLWGTSN